jgi:hypothetical protein
MLRYALQAAELILFERIDNFTSVPARLDLFSLSALEELGAICRESPLAIEATRSENYDNSDLGSTSSRAGRETEKE